MLHGTLKARMLEIFRFRMYFYVIVVAVAFFILSLQVINLQLIHGTEYKNRAKSNMENYVPIPAPRGEIYDRNFRPDEPGIHIVTNRPSFNITTIPARFKSKSEFKKVLKILSKILGMKDEDLKLEMKDRNPWERVLLIEDVTLESIVKIASNQHLVPNIDWEDAPVRIYSYSNMFSHLVGYIGSISLSEYKARRNEGYKYYHKIGKSGIEKEYDSILRGRDGFIRRVVDVKNRTGGEDVGQKPIAGNNIILTLDYEVQKRAYESMGDLNGAVVVIKASTGEVITMLSKPDFDPNHIIAKDNSEIIKELMNDKNHPFLNRAIQAKYPPASTFKLVTAIAALETERALPSKTYYCQGKYTLKGTVDRDFYCFKPHGSVDLNNAIAQSCSVYFYQLGQLAGPLALMKYAGYFGLDEKTGIDIPGEDQGFIPSKEWKYKNFGQSWYDGDTVNMSIGQGYLTTTPIELANLLAAIINNGIVYKPKIIREIRTPDNKDVIRSFAKDRLRETPLSLITINAVKKGMRQGVIDGTQSQLSLLKIQAAGKTGTAQTKSVRKEDSSQHAWYVGYAPFDGPPEKAYIVCVMVEFGMWGATKAVPIAYDILAKMDKLGYFK